MQLNIGVSYLNDMRLTAHRAVVPCAIAQGFLVLDLGLGGEVFAKVVVPS